jgi:glutathione synthase/RimK-type ligase-like ATP-grasp enzyme
MERQQALKEAIADFHARLQKIVRQFPAWQREAKEKLAALNHETAASAIRRLIDDLKTRYAVHTPLIQHLEALGNTLIDHSHEFITGHEDSKLPALGTSTTIRPPPALWLESPGQQRHDPWRARCLRRAASSRQPI